MIYRRVCGRCNQKYLTMTHMQRICFDCKIRELQFKKDEEAKKKERVMALVQDGAEVNEF